MIMMQTSSRQQRGGWRAAPVLPAALGAALLLPSLAFANIHLTSPPAAAAGEAGRAWPDSPSRMEVQRIVVAEAISNGTVPAPLALAVADVESDFVPRTVGVSGTVGVMQHAWLGDHLPAAQAQRKFHAMVEFLERTRGTDFTEGDIDDETVLRFWLARLEGGASASSGPNTDFRGYRNTFLAFLALFRVLAAGAELGRFERFVPIGSDFEAGEIDPAAGAAPTVVPEEEDPLDRLQEEPAIAVKALNRRERALLRLPVGETDGVRRLPRSWLRAECFGPVQNRLSQALRRKGGPAELAAIAATGPESGYAAWIETLETTDAHVRRVAKACLYVLHRMGEARAGSGGGDTGNGVFRLDFRLLGEAREAFDGLNRAGFQRSAPNDPRLAPAWRVLARELPAVSERLGKVLRTLGPPARWEAAESEDGPVFSDAFARLYAPSPGVVKKA